MSKSFETELYKRLHGEICKIKIIDCHEHLQRESELQQGDDIHTGRFFMHYANHDLLSAGMPADDMTRVMTDASLSPLERWNLFKPWYEKSWNTSYCESIRIALRDIYGVDDFSDNTVDIITERMRQAIKPGFTRQIFDQAGIDFAMNNPFEPKFVFNPDYGHDCFICDMTDSFTSLDVEGFKQELNIEISSLDDYLCMIDGYFERHAHLASAFKTPRAYDRIMTWDDIPKSQATNIFDKLIMHSDKSEIKALEDFILHYLCEKCGEYDLRMKFHTGLQEGAGNIITNSRAALLSNLFLKYPKTKFDIYHISYPYQDELSTIAKNFANVTVDFCWVWVISPAVGRRALSEMLETVPANKIHGFGGDYIFVEGTYAHAVMARREITRVLCEKVEEGSFTEAYALKVAQMLLRDNAMENFDLTKRRNATS